MKTRNEHAIEFKCKLTHVMENHKVHDKVLDKNVSADSKSWSPTSVTSINVADETVSMIRKCFSLEEIFLYRMHAACEPDVGHPGP